MSLPEILTSKELAFLHGITVQALGHLDSRSIIKKSGRNSYAVSESAKVSEHYRAMAAGRSETELSKEKARLAAAQADLTEQKLAVARGEYLPAGDVKRRWDTAAGLTRAAVLGAPSEIAQELAHLTRHDIDRIDRILRDALARAADEIDGLGDDDHGDEGSPASPSSA